MKLLDPTSANPSALDAIIVPTSHDTENLRTAIDLAAQLRCPLVALCSRSASAGKAAELAAERGIEIAAIDLADLPAALWPSFATYQLLADTEFAHQRDTSAKRNFGLLLASFAGWERIFFLDDDIHVSDPEDVRRAAQLLDEYDAVGLRIADFPDNSVVCHANRETGGVQTTFIGGGALAVDVGSMSSFFPNVYNEDWFFLLGDDQLRPSATIGEALQDSYDPYATQHRAKAEEFGDSLAEGVFCLLDQGYPLRNADETYWREFLEARWEFISELIDRVDRVARPPDNNKRMRAALKAALDRSERITPRLCVDYLAAWEQDREDWRQHVEGLKKAHQATGPASSPRSAPTTLERVLSELGLTDRCRYLRGLR